MIHENQERGAFMGLPQKNILINHFQAVEDYLKLDVRNGKHLRFIELMKNRYIPEVKNLLEIIPESFHPTELQKFYERTGLKILVEIYNSEYEVTMYDRKGKYPREDAVIWNKDFREQVAEHPEWLEPQEEADLLIRWIFPLEEKKENIVVHHYQFILR